MTFSPGWWRIGSSAIASEATLRRAMWRRIERAKIGEGASIALWTLGKEIPFLSTPALPLGRRPSLNRQS